MLIVDYDIFIQIFAVILRPLPSREINPGDVMLITGDNNPHMSMTLEIDHSSFPEIYEERQ